MRPVLPAARARAVADPERGTMPRSFKDIAKSRALAVLRRFPGDIGETMRAGTYARETVRPAPPAMPDPRPWFPVGEVGAAGLDLREHEQLERLRRWRSNRYQALYTKLRHEPSINTERLGGTSLTNGWYNTP